MKTRIIAVTNNKGGVGKTTTVVNLAAGLAEHGRHVMVIDADPQANASFVLLGSQAPQRTLYDTLISNSSPLSDLIRASHTQGVDIIPSKITMSAADIALAAIPGRERLLARKLRAITGYDYILIDTPPSLGILTVNSLTASSEVFIPVGVGTFSLMGIKLLEDTVNQLRDNLELDFLNITGAIATLYDRTRVAKDTVAALQMHFGDLFFRSIIPKYKDIEEANSRSMSVFEYAPQSKGGQAYHALVEEVICGES